MNKHIDKDELVIYQAADNADFQIEVRVKDDTVWLNRHEIAQFSSTHQAKLLAVSVLPTHRYKINSGITGQFIRLIMGFCPLCALRSTPSA